MFVNVSRAQIIDSLVDIEEENPKEQNVWQRFKYDGLTAYQGLKYTYSRPFHWKEKDFLTAGAFVASEAILYSVDTNLNRYFQDQSPHAPQFLKDFGWYYGSPQNNYMAMGGVYLFGLFTNNQKVRRTGVLMISAASAAGLIQTITKNAIGRARPGTGDGKHFFKPFSKEGGYHSMPSGHSILSFTMAHAIAKQFDNIWVKSGIYAVGLVAPVSRLWAGAHWATDIGAGIFISVVTVDAVDNFLFKERKYDVDVPYKQQRKISWHFTPGAGTIGFVGVF
ncbi:Membrane-associated phospholipid phosphatase [Pustulibacterium marinum]|uniref:Membrane-associated phospholipid phosphatase n=2 Tax=Pustulibacterium marinum TaxID=1224947 RepID=A0A1I7FCT0_9FLAO|nr:Membrane-associated phospholipid phosphatase [Pustulibacterium marinum]